MEKTYQVLKKRIKDASTCSQARIPPSGGGSAVVSADVVTGISMVGTVLVAWMGALVGTGMFPKLRGVLFVVLCG